METSVAPVVAVIGGGQLARMMSEEASALGIHLRALVEAADGSTGSVLADAPVGAADDEVAVRALMEGADVLTFEHEHQSGELLTALQAEGVSVEPRHEALLLARDKILMRQAMDRAGVSQPAWMEAQGSAEEMRAQAEAFAGEHGWPFIMKTPRGGYDGHGVLLVRSAEELQSGTAADWIEAAAQARAGRAAEAGGGGSLGGAAVTSLLLEEAVPFTRELAVLLARSRSGEMKLWPVVESVQSDGICAEVIAPAPGLEPEAVQAAEQMARTIAETFDVTGVLAVELFAVEKPGQPTRLYVNELAMRPHNSGHWTQDGALTSQFAQHLRAVAGLPLGATTPTARATVMINILGGDQAPAAGALAQAMRQDPDAHIHLYGKQWRPRRKLGHVNLTLPGDPNIPATPEEIDDLLTRARAVAAILQGPSRR